MAKWSDDAKLGSGLPDRFFLTVASAKVGTPYERNPTQSAVIIEGEADVDGEISDEHLWLKTGAFESGDKEGTFLVHETQDPSIYDDPTAKKKRINKSTGYGKFLGSAEESIGFDVLASLQDDSREKYQIWDVKFWEGLTLDVEVIDEPYDFVNKETNERVVGSSRQPYVRGLVEKGKGKSVGAAAASAPAEAPASTSTNGSISEAQAKLLAKSAGNHMAYLEAYVEAGGDPSDEMAKKPFYVEAKSG